MNFISLIYIILIILAFYFIGSLVTSIINYKESTNNFYKCFVNLVLGMLVSVTIYAFVLSRGNTILWGLCLVGGIYIIKYLRNKKNFSRPVSLLKTLGINKEMLFPLLTILLLSVAFFILHGSYFYHTPFNYLPHGDYSYYSTIVDSLNKTGVESIKISGHVFLDESLSPTPYHYIELWLAALASKLSGVLAIESLVVLSLSILNVILATGMIAITKHFTKSIILQSLSVCFIFLSGIIIVNILPQTESYIFANGWTPKTIIISIFFLWFIALSLRKDKYFYLPLLLLPIINISLAPAVFSTLVFVGLYYFIKKKKSGFIIFETIIVALFIVVFYYLNAKSSATGNFTIQNIIEGYKNNILQPFKIIAGSLVITAIIYGIYTVPVVIAFLLKRRKRMVSMARNMKQILWILVSIFFTGLIFWALTYPISDSIQFFYLPSILLLNLVVYLTILQSVIIFTQNQTKIKYLGIAISLLYVAISVLSLSKSPFYNKKDITQGYSEEYISTVSSHLIKNNDEEYLVATIRDQKKIKGFWASISQGYGFFLKLSFSNVHQISLDALSVDLTQFNQIEKERVQQNFNKNPFYQYALLQNNYDNISEIQFSFILNKNIKNIFTDDLSLLNEKILELSDTIIVDDSSNQYYVRLK